MFLKYIILNFYLSHRNANFTLISLEQFVFHISKGARYFEYELCLLLSFILSKYSQIFMQTKEYAPRCWQQLCVTFLSLMYCMAIGKAWRIERTLKTMK